MKKESIGIDDVLTFQSMQASLLDAFFIKYKYVNDFELLLDFPKTGEIILDDGSCWSFFKHGKGIRFNRIEPEPNVCVNAHTHIRNKKLITIWRLSRYFSSLDNKVTNEDIEALIQDMELQGMISKISGGYILN